jgi:glycosyltransferase involved in cell wall biosynthesis
MSLISIIMPAYNAEQYIYQAIQSVCEQTHPNWELIIIDDASTDKTASVYQQFQDDRIRPYLLNGLGSPAKARNAGIKMAQGDFIMFLDADDYYYPHTLETLLWAIQKEPPSCLALYGFPFIVDVFGVPKNQYYQFHNKQVILNSGQKQPHLTWYDVLSGNANCLVSSFIFPKTTFQTVGLFNEDLAAVEDFEYNIRLFHAGAERLGVYPGYVFHYRIHPNSLTKDPTRYQIIQVSAFKILDWVFDTVAAPEVKTLNRSILYMKALRYLALERIKCGAPQLARQILKQGLQCKHIQRRDYIRLSLLPWCFSVIPTCLVSILLWIKKR